MSVFGSHKSIQVLTAGAPPVQGRVMELDLGLLEFPSVLQHHSNITPSTASCLGPAPFLWEVSGLPPKLPIFSPGWAAPSSKQPHEAVGVLQSSEATGKPQAEMSHVSHCLQLPAKLFSCRNSFWQIHCISNPFMPVKPSKRRAAEHKAAVKVLVVLLTCRSEFSRSASRVFSSWAFSFSKSLLWFWLFWRLCFSWLISFSSSSSWEEKQKFENVLKNDSLSWVEGTLIEMNKEA